MTVDKVTEVKAGLTESKATISLSHISQNEIEKNEEGTLYIYEGKACGRRSDAFVRNGANGGPTRVLGIKCIVDRGVTQMIFPLLWAQKIN